MCTLRYTPDVSVHSRFPNSINTSYELCVSLVSSPSLPSAITYSLLLSLKEKFPRQASSSSLTDESQLTILAHIFYCWWIIRVLARGSLPVHPPQGLLWEGTCATHDSIEQLVSVGGLLCSSVFV